MGFLLHTAYGQTPIAQKTTRQIGPITLTFDTSSTDVNTNVVTIQRGSIHYDLTTVTADKIEIDQAHKHGLATGHVHVDDPTAIVDADTFELWWDPTDKHGTITNAFLRVGTAHIHAESADFHPHLWILRNCEGTTSLAKPPWYQLRSPTVSLIPGQNGKIKKPTLYILGKKIVTLPDHSFELDPRTEGLGIPSITYSQGLGFGPSWGGGLLLNHDTNLAFAAGAFPASRPVYGAIVTKSLLTDDTAPTLLTPYSDMSERFTFGYLDDVHVVSPNQEEHYLRFDRRSISLDSQWNQEAPDRGGDVAYSKAAEAVYEQGGPAGLGGYRVQARLQSISELGDGFVTRALWVGDLELPQVRFTPNFYSIGRIDTTVYTGASHQYGWVRGEFGTAYEPFRQLRLAAGAFVSKDAGTPDFAIDRLVGTEGMLVRGDLNLGPTKLSWMTKYDTTLKWYDTEYSVSQVIGCFEPYMVHRRVPNEYILGLRLNLGSLTDLVTKRNLPRPNSVSSPATPTVISPAPSGNP